MMERQATDNLTLGGRHLDLDSGSSSVWVWFCLCCFVREDPSPKTSFTPRALASGFLSPRLFCVHHAYPPPNTILNSSDQTACAGASTWPPPVLPVGTPPQPSGKGNFLLGLGEERGRRNEKVGVVQEWSLLPRGLAKPPPARGGRAQEQRRRGVRKAGGAVPRPEAELKVSSREGRKLRALCPLRLASPAAAVGQEA